MVAQNSLRDMRIAQLVQTWLSVVAPHVDYHYCCEAAKVGLEYGNELVSFPCPKCGAVYCDPVECAMKLQAQHVHVWYVSTSGLSTHLCRGILWLCWDAN